MGGGALGIQYATDIAELYPTKQITLIHSRQRFLTLFDPSLHDEIFKRLISLNVDVILNDRVLLPKIGQKGCLAPPEGDHYNSVTLTQRGRRIEADLRVCPFLLHWCQHY